MIRAFSQALEVLWLKLPIIKLDIADLPPPRMLYIDDGAVNDVWGWFGLLPLSSETVLFLRYIDFSTESSTGDNTTRHMIFHSCGATEASLRHVLHEFPQLETLVLFDTEVNDLASALLALPTTLQHVHILDHEFKFDEIRPSAPHALPRLKSLTFTWLPLSTQRGSQPPSNDDRFALSKLQQAVESIVDAPQCTFKYLRSAKSPEDALADAMATLKLDL